MKTINLVLGIHNHQPVGNFDSVFRHAFERAYQPFLDVVERYPVVKMATHYSGILLDWFLQNEPDFIARLRKLVKSGQVEMMGGSYYEAILSIIPDEDKQGQLEKLSRASRKHFGETPTGMWLAERVWEQHLTKTIAQAGMSYTVVDDTHFKYAGFAEEELLGYYLTEEQGEKIAIFPISKRLRYTIPFQPVQQTIDYLREVATEEGDRVVVYADDGEKFGIWPGTYDHVYTNRWLEEFLSALSNNADWINIVHFRDVLKTIPPMGLTYLPNASYAEMLHWALPTHHFPLYEEFEQLLQQQGIRDRYESFFKGGFWRNFLAKYPESNMMHKKMLYVSKRVQALRRNRKKPAPRVLEQIKNHLYASQCNDAYWHGIFGGLYLPILRSPIYRNLIAAERELDKLERLDHVREQRFDLDCDGQEEVVLESPLLNCYLKPGVGGTAIELDFKPANLNVLDIVSRHPEGYHAKLKQASDRGTKGEVASIHDMVRVKEEGLERYLVYDSYQRASLIDHFFGLGTTVEQMERSNYQEVGDFIAKPYSVKTKKRKKAYIVELSRHGTIAHDGYPHRIFLRKTITLEPTSSALVVDYLIANEEERPVPVWFGIEVNVGLQAGNAPDRYYYLDNGTLDDRVLRSMGEVCGIHALGLRDEWMGVDVRVEVDTAATFWRFPIEVVSLSESGFERIFQSSVVIPHWQFELEKEWRVRLIHSFKLLKS